MIAVGALIANAGLIALVFALIWALDIRLPLWAAALIAGVVVILAGGGLAWAGWQRLHVDGIVPEKTVETIKENARWAKLRDNPLPAAITAAGVGYLLFRAFTGPSSGVSSRAKNGGGHAIASSVEEVVDAAGEKVTEARTAVTERTAAGVAKMQGVARTAGEQTSRTSDRLKRMIDENPAAAVVVALGVGAAAGMALPNTNVEKEFLGSATQEMADQAREKVSEVGERASRAAQRAGDAARKEMKA